MTQEPAFGAVESDPDAPQSDSGEKLGDLAVYAATGGARVAKASAYVIGGGLVAAYGDSQKPEQTTPPESHNTGREIPDAGNIGASPTVTFPDLPVEPHPDAPAPVATAPAPDLGLPQGVGSFEFHVQVGAPSASIPEIPAPPPPLPTQPTPYAAVPDSSPPGMPVPGVPGLEIPDPGAMFGNLLNPSSAVAPIAGESGAAEPATLHSVAGDSFAGVGESATPRAYPVDRTDFGDPEGGTGPTDAERHRAVGQPAANTSAAPVYREFSPAPSASPNPAAFVGAAAPVGGLAAIAPTVNAAPLSATVGPTAAPIAAPVAHPTTPVTTTPLQTTIQPEAATHPIANAGTVAEGPSPLTAPVGTPAGLLDRFFHFHHQIPVQVPAFEQGAGAPTFGNFFRPSPPPHQSGTVPEHPIAPAPSFPLPGNIPGRPHIGGPAVPGNHTDHPLPSGPHTGIPIPGGHDTDLPFLPKPPLPGTEHPGALPGSGHSRPPHDPSHSDNGTLPWQGVRPTKPPTPSLPSDRPDDGDAHPSRPLLPNHPKNPTPGNDEGLQTKPLPDHDRPSSGGSPPSIPGHSGHGSAPESPGQSGHSKLPDSGGSLPDSPSLPGPQELPHTMPHLPSDSGLLSPLPHLGHIGLSEHLPALSENLHPIGYHQVWHDPVVDGHHLVVLSQL